MAAAVSEWADVICDLTIEQINQGIRKMRDEYRDWPPTTGQFRKLCKADAEYNDPIHPYYRALPESAEERQRLDNIGKEIFARLRKDGVIG